MNIFLFILAILIPPVLLTLADIFLFEKNKKILTIIKSFVRDFLYLNMAAMVGLYNFLEEKNLLFPNHHTPIYFAKFAGISVGAGVVYLIARAIFGKLLKREEDKPKKKGWAITARVFAAIFVFLGVAAFVGTVWGKEAFYDVSPDQMLITILSPTTGTDNTIMMSAIEGPVLSTIFATYVFCMMFVAFKKFTFKGKVIFKEFAIRIIAVVLSIAILGSGLAYGIIKFDLEKIYQAYNDQSPYIEENYQDPNTVKMQFPEKKRNLIHIYLESIENSYFSKELGGYIDTNLMPNLAELSKDGISFSNKGEGEGFGGPHKTYGGTWSVGSMVNQAFGFPMKVPTGGNNYGTPGHFFPGAVSLGDILHQQGYEQTMMIGADAEFGGLVHMFTDHGKFKIMDHKYAQENDMLPSKSYNVNWGYEDAKLYEFAKEELTRLAATGKPFNFVMENADSHFPGFAFDGDTPIFEKNDLTKEYDKTIQFSEKDIVEFVRWIQAQPFYENTTIVMIGDHLSMDKTFFEKYHFEGSGYERTTYNLILNPSPEVANTDTSRYYNRVWGNCDMFPTLLASIGVKIEGERLALGTNLFSNEPTIYERDGYSKVTDEFVSGSRFYDRTFLLGKTEFKGDNITTY